MQPEPLSLGEHHVSPNLRLVTSLHASVALRFERLITLKCDVAGVDRNAARHSFSSVHGCSTRFPKFHISNATACN